MVYFIHGLNTFVYVINMRVHIDNIDYKLLHKLINNSEPYKKINIILTSQGIFTNQKGRYYVLTPIDVPCKYVTYQNIDMVLDLSHFETKEETFNLPSDKCVADIRETYYILTDNIMMVTHICNDDIVDIFFECDTSNEMVLVHNVYDIIRDNHIECGTI
jgi:hypothetical protein